MWALSCKRGAQYWNTERFCLTGIKPSVIIVVTSQGLQLLKKKKGGDKDILSKIDYWTVTVTFVSVAHSFPKRDRTKARWFLAEALWRKVKAMMQPLLWCFHKQLQGNMRIQWQDDGEKCSKFPDTVMKQENSCKILFALVRIWKKKTTLNQRLPSSLKENDIKDPFPLPF